MNRLFLARLELRQFRNFEIVEISPKERFNIISGPNGSGKTNLLEAIYFFGALRSFRTSYRTEIIRQGSSAAKLKGLFSGAASGLECEMELGAGLRKIRSGGKEVTSTSGHFSELPMVLFHPANMSLVQGGPEERRRFLDRALFQAHPGYPAIRSDYGKALQSRNRLLKQPRVSRGLLAPFDDQLATLGARMVSVRSDFLSQTAPRFEEAFHRTSKGLLAAIRYEPDVAGTQEEILQALDQAFSSDERRGFTSRGPHADEVVIEVTGRPARRFASQGQQRMAVLSLKIAETQSLQEATGRVPILLMDDISSELDRERNRELFEFLRTVGGQVFITTTHLDHVLIDDDRQDFSVVNGTVSPQDM